MKFDSDTLSVRLPKVKVILMFERMLFLSHYSYGNEMIASLANGDSPNYLLK